MPELILKPVTPGRLNKPAWYCTRTAEVGPDAKNDDGTVTADVCLDGERTGSVTAPPKAGTPGREGAQPAR